MRQDVRTAAYKPLFGPFGQDPVDELPHVVGGLLAVSDGF